MITASRTDGLGQRLLCLMQSMYLSEKYNRDFHFLWLGATTREEARDGAVLHSPVNWFDLFDKNATQGFVANIHDAKYIRKLERLRNQFPITEENLSNKNNFLHITNIPAQLKFSVPEFHINSPIYKEIFNQKLKLSTEVASKSQKFLAKHFNKQSKIVGFHFRSGDINEIDPDFRRYRDYKDTVKSIRKEVNLDIFDKIHIMCRNDDTAKAFTEAMQNEFKDKEVFVFDDFYNAENYKIMDESNPKGGAFIHGNDKSVIDAMIQTIILSKCDFIVRCPAQSCLSTVAAAIGNVKFFNMKKAGQWHSS